MVVVSSEEGVVEEVAGAVAEEAVVAVAGEVAGVAANLYEYKNE